MERGGGEALGKACAINAVWPAADAAALATHAADDLDDDASQRGCMETQTPAHTARAVPGAGRPPAHVSAPPLLRKPRCGDTLECLVPQIPRACHSSSFRRRAASLVQCHRPILPSEEGSRAGKGTCQWQETPVLVLVVGSKVQGILASS